MCACQHLPSVADCQAAAALAGLDADVARLPDGYQTLVGAGVGQCHCNSHVNKCEAALRFYVCAALTLPVPTPPLYPLGRRWARPAAWSSDPWRACAWASRACCCSGRRCWCSSTTPTASTPQCLASRVRALAGRCSMPVRCLGAHPPPHPPPSLAPCPAPSAAEVVARLRAAGAAVVLTANAGSAAALQAALPGDVRTLLLDGSLRPLP